MIEMVWQIKEWHSAEWHSVGWLCTPMACIINILQLYMMTVSDDHKWQMMPQIGVSL